MRLFRWTIGALIVVTWTVGPAGQQPGATLIRAGRVFDSEAGRFLDRQDILVSNGRIDAVGVELDVPPDATVLDLSGYTILPGLIDAHTHLLFLQSVSPNSDQASALLGPVLTEGDSLRALHGAARARTFLAAGITTVRDLGNSGRFADVALMRAINDGSHDGPRMMVSGPGLGPPGGQFPGLQPEYLELAAAEYRIVSGSDNAATAVREHLVLGASVIKVYADSLPNRGKLSLAELTAIVAEAERHNVPVAAHAISDDAIRTAVEAGVRSIEHGYGASDATLDEMARRGVVLVPTIVDRETATEAFGRLGLPPAAVAQALQEQSALLRRAVDAGVTIAVGSDQYLDLGIPQGEAARRILIALHEAGLGPVAILQAATVVNAALLGQEGRLGVIKPGALADIVGIEGNPDEDFSAIERVRFVMKGGVVYQP